MNFKLTEEQQLLRETLKELVKEKIAPNALYYDQNWEFPKKNVELLFEIGCMA